MRVVLSIFLGKTERCSFSIVRDQTVIGRARECDVRIALSSISRRHCRLIRDGNELTIEDLGSANGTYHNGNGVQKAVLAAGDKIGVGPMTLLVRIDDMPPPISDADPADAATDFPVQEIIAEEETSGVIEEDSFVDLESDARPEKSPPA